MSTSHSVMDESSIAWRRLLLASICAVGACAGCDFRSPAQAGTSASSQTSTSRADQDTGAYRLRRVMQLIDHPDLDKLMEAEILVSRAMVEFNSDLPRAMALCRKALEIDPENPLAHCRLGEGWFKQDKYNEAILSFRAAIRLAPEFAYVHRTLADVLHRARDLTAAENAYRAAIGVAWGNGMAYNEVNTMTPKQAIDFFTQQVAKHPDDWLSLWKRGNARYKSDSPRDALADYTLAIKIQPRMAVLFHNRALARKALGEIDAAFDDYSAAIKLDPKYGAAYCNRGDILFAAGKYRDATADYTDFTKLCPTDGSGWWRRGRCKHVIGDLDGAIAELTRSLRGTDFSSFDVVGETAEHRRTKFGEMAVANPRDFVALLLLGIEYDESENFDRAKDSYTRAIQISPQCSLLFSQRAECRRSLGDLDGAVADATEAIRLDSQDCKAFSTRGLARRTLNQVDAALADFNESVRLYPTSKLSYDNRGLVWHDKKNYQKAFADATQALRLDPTYANGYHNRGHSLLYTQRYSEACDQFTIAIWHNDQYARAYLNRGKCFKALGQLDAAREDFQKAQDIAQRTKDIKLFTRAHDELAAVNE